MIILKKILLSSVFLTAACQQHIPLNRTPERVIREALPSTKIAHMDCVKLPGLCEVITAKNVFYATHDGRYILVGRVFDVQELEDITEPVLLKLEPERMLTGAVSAKQPKRLISPARAKIKALPQKITWSDLPKKGAVVWGKIGAQKVAVFSDPKCPHCKRLSVALEEMDVEVHEYFVNFMGSRDLSSAILCARDRDAMRRSVFAGEMPHVPISNCDTSVLDQNDQFAAAHKIQGTPFLISADGRVLPGFAGRQQLLVWLQNDKGGQK